jgi:hypothetical protein
MRTLALPDAVERWSLTTLREKLIKIDAKIVRHGRYEAKYFLVQAPKESGHDHPGPRLHFAHLAHAGLRGTQNPVAEECKE